MWLSAASPGTHEFSDAWLATAYVVERSELSKLFALVLAASAAIATNGRWYEGGVLSPEYSPTKLMALWVGAAPTGVGPLLDIARTPDQPTVA